MTQLFSQHETDNWYFGYNAGISFSSGSPGALTNGALTSDEGCSSISDSAGNLLFYTNGVKVWDKNHQLMPNGIGLYGHTSATQSVLIVKRPSWAGRYYIFTTDIVYPGFTDEGLNYSEVNMTLNGGNGDIISGLKNINLVPDSVPEKLCGVKHSNGTDVWIMVHKWYSNSFLAYLVTSAGIIAPPIISNTGTSQNDFAGEGAMKFSSTGNKIALASEDSGYFELFDFDPSSGIVSNSLLLRDNHTQGAYGVEFSADGSKLYVDCVSQFNDTVYQYNLSAGSDSLIIASKTALGNVNTLSYLGQLQLASDGKIYIARDGIKKLAVINYPNNLGLSCNLVANGFTLISPGENELGLPNFVASYLLPTGIKENSLTTTFSIYPNPTNTILNLSLDKAENITVTNLIGNVVLETNAKGKVELDVSFLSAGIYFIRVGNEVRKFVKE